MRIKASELHKHVPHLSELDVPKFKSEREELEWLDRNYERLADLTIKHGVPVTFVQREKTKQISIRIPVSDIEAAQKIAKAHRENYQSVLKRALRRGLIQEKLT